MKCKTNYKSEDGKCVKRKGLFGNGKKSFNPFKMWGSYVGLVLGLIYGWFFQYGRELYYSMHSYWFNQTFPISIFSDYGTFLWGLTTGIAGFLLGWGIHSIVRRIRK